MWDLIVSVPDHCLSFYFTIKKIFGGILPLEGEKMQKCIPAPLSFRLFVVAKINNNTTP